MPSDVTQWLASIGLQQYADQFASNDIDLDLLAELDHDLLQQIGVSSVGHRLRLLREAALLASEEDSAGSPAGAAAGVATNPAPAERRQLTVMFCDLVSSTALSAQLDPEDLREVVRGYQQAAERVVARFDGHIAQFLGDGLLVYFGYPQAHENDAERAVLAGLGIPQAIHALNVRLRRRHGVQLSVRIGIHTGPVVVGQVGTEQRHENLALGETPNLAARLQGIADTDTVLISDSTRRLLGEAFEFESLGLQHLKGIAQPMVAYVVRGEQQVETRFGAGHTNDTGAIIGRDRDLELLKHCWHDALASHGQMVLISGEAGIGKSRLIRGLTDELGVREANVLSHAQLVRLTYQCSPYYTDTALYPAFTQLRRAARIDPHDPATAQLDKLESLLLKGADDISVAAPLLGSMMGMGEAVSVRYGENEYSPQEQRELALQVLREQLYSLSKRLPVLFIIEDAHWMDPTTRALTELLLNTIGEHRVLLLVTTRPGFEENYGSHAHLTRISLSRLNRDHAADIINRLTGGKPFPDSLVAEIIEKADGVPLYVEEISKSILESGELIETDSAYELPGNASALTVPNSLQDSLMARLDRLKSIKVVAQTAACIGRDFGFRLLHQVLPMARDALLSALDQLVAGDLIVATGNGADAVYSFRHALVRDAAYESQLKSRRQQVHRDILARLEEDSAAPQVLAYHASQAGDVMRAVQYWEQAGDFAFGQPAYLEAVSNYQRAANALADAADSNPDKAEEYMRRELGINSKLMRALSAGRGLTHHETVAAIERGELLQDEVGDPARRFDVIFNAMNISVGQAAYDKAYVQADRLCEEGKANDDPIQLSIAYRVRAFAQMGMGNYDDALVDYEKSWQLSDPAQDAETLRRYGIHNGVALRCSFSQALASTGQGERAQKLLAEAEPMARRANVPATLGFALSTIAAVYQVARWPHARQFAQDALEEVQKFKLVAWASSLMCTVGALMMEQGDYEQAEPMLRNGIEYRRRNAGLIFLPYHLALHAACLYALGREGQGQKVEDEALEMMKHGTEQWASSEVHRLLAVAGFQRDGDRGRALNRLEHAQRIASEQNAILWELRVVSSLCELLISNDPDRARAEMAQIIRRFPTEGRNMPDYQGALRLAKRLGINNRETE